MVRWLTNDFIYLFGSLGQLSNWGIVFKLRRIVYIYIYIKALVNGCRTAPVKFA